MGEKLPQSEQKDLFAPDPLRESEEQISKVLGRQHQIDRSKSTTDHVAQPELEADHELLRRLEESAKDQEG